MKQVCVIGLGQFGSHLSKTLAEMGCEVLAIDHNEARVAGIQKHVQRALIIDVRQLDALKAVIDTDIEEVIVSLGGSIESSTLCVLHLKRIGVKKIRVKAVSTDHGLILKALGANEVIFPERQTAEILASKIMNPNLMDFIPITKDYLVVEISAPETFYGKNLIELALRKRYNITVIGVKEPVHNRFAFLPAPTFVINPGSILVVIGKESQIQEMTGKK